jgi:acyl carrier protein
MDVSIEQVTALLVTSFGVSAEEIRPDATFAELDVDSLALVEFALLVHKELGVPLDEDEISGTHTVRDVVALIEGKKALL